MLRSLLLVASLCISLCFAAESVITLDESNFDSVVDNADFIVVEFYAPWCGHCKRLAPEYEEAATILLNEEPPVKLAKVDATENAGLGERFEVRGYPTLKVFRNGKASDYEGPRDAAGIVSYIRSIAGPSVKQVDSAAKLLKIRGGNAVVVTSYGSESSEFESVADELRSSTTFVEASTSFAPEAFSGKIVLSRRDDDVDVIYSGEGDLKSFVLANSLAVGGEITRENRAKYAETGLPLLTVYLDVDYSESNVKHTNYFKRRVQKVAGEFTDKMVFGFSDFKNLPDRGAYGQPEGREFAVTIDHKGLKYGSEHEKFSLNALREFANAFLEGNLEAHVKSEPIPSSNDGPVTVVVGKTFDDIVMDDSKDVMIEFYAPWCGHCKKLIPAYDELGQMFSEDESVVIAKIDATANDHTGDFEVRGFPTIYFRPAGGEPIAYNGARDAESMAAFVKENAKTL